MKTSLDSGHLQNILKKLTYNDAIWYMVLKSHPMGHHL